MDLIFPNIHPRALDPLISSESLIQTLRAWTIPSFSIEKVKELIANALHDIDLFENCIQQLRARQAALRRDVTRYRSLHSPIRKLPPEILRHIFGYACILDPAIEYPFQSTAFCISSVCSRWRDIALHSPEVWANLNVCLGERAINPVCLAVSRSHNYPLSLRVSEAWGQDDACENLFRILMEQSERWLYVDFSEATSDTVDMLEGLSLTPLLEDVTLTAYHAPEIFGYIGSAPCLRNVTFQKLEDPIFFDNFTWETIRHLDMEYDGKLTPESLFEVLDLGTGLQSLVYRGEARTRLEGSDPVPYTLFGFDDLPHYTSNLTSFAISLGDSEGFYNLLHDVIMWLTLPSLTDLSIRHDENPGYRTKCGFTVGGEWPRDVIHGFLNRSGCTLTSLTLEGMPLLEPDVIALLKLTPSLQSFTLREMWASDAVVIRPYKPPPQTTFRTVTQALLRQLEAPIFTSDAFSSQTPLLPKLSRLKLGVQHHFDAGAEFVDMVRSRWGLPRDSGIGSGVDTERLREVVLSVMDGKLVEEIYEPLKRLDSEGMMISVFEHDRRVI